MARELRAEGGKELLCAGESDGDLVRRTSNGDVIDDSGKSDPGTMCWRMGCKESEKSRVPRGQP